jgi:hypothetical protein
MSLRREVITAPPSGSTSHVWLNIKEYMVDDSLRYATYPHAIWDIDVGRVGLFLSALSTSQYPVVSALKEMMYEALTSDRRLVANQFAHRAAQKPSVREVWLSSLEPEFRISIITEGLDLERDLDLRMIFIDLLRIAGDVSAGELEIYAGAEGDEDDIPIDARSGDKLF